MTVEYGKLSCVKEKVTLRNKIGGLEAEVADFRQSLAQFQDRHGRDLLRMAELVAENDTLKKAALQDQKHRRTHELAQGILERRVKELEATTAVWGGEWCAENRAAGRGPCGACAWCCKEATDRAEAAERRARRLEAAVARRTSVKVPVQERTLRDQLAAVEAECEERAETMRGQVKEIHRLEGELGAACRLNSGVEVRMPPAACCVLCSLPITVGGIRGMGDGSGNRFAHEACYWRKRAEDAETIGDYADDLRDRVCLQDDNKVLQIKVEEMRAEASEALQTVAEMEVDREALDRRIKTLEAKLVGVKSMKHSYWEELKAISECVPPGEHDRHLTHQGALLQRVEDLMAQLARLIAAAKKFRDDVELVNCHKNHKLLCEFNTSLGHWTPPAKEVQDFEDRKCAESKVADEKEIYYQDIEALKTAVASEKARRVYYQDIVYAICLRLDLIGSPGKRVVCGTVEEPSQEVQEAMVQVLVKLGELRKENTRLKEIAKAAHSLAQKIKAV